MWSEREMKRAGSWGPVLSAAAREVVVEGVEVVGGVVPAAEDRQSIRCQVCGASSSSEVDRFEVSCPCMCACQSQTNPAAKRPDDSGAKTDCAACPEFIFFSLPRLQWLSELQAGAGVCSMGGEGGKRRAVARGSRFLGWARGAADASERGGASAGECRPGSDDTRQAR